MWRLAQLTRVRVVMCRSPVHRLLHLPVDGAGGVQEGGRDVRRGAAAQLGGGQDQGPTGETYYYYYPLPCQSLIRLLC